MIIIIDSNIFISALVKEGITRKLITQSKEWLIIPEYLFHEIRNHEEEIILKSGINKREYELLLRVLLKYIIIVPNEIILSYRKQAMEIVKNIDADDALFIATAIAFEDSVIWSNDKKLKNQNRVEVLNTEEIFNLSARNSWLLSQ